MGWYIRKGFNFGPLRLNLSRSGLGASFGVKGARIGLGPRGSYVHMGRGGLYYRQSLESGQHERSSRIPYASNPSATIPDGLQEIDSVDISQLTDASSEEILKELNRVRKYVEIFPILFILIILGLLFIYYGKTLQWSYYVVFLIAIPILIFARHTDVTKGTAILQYDFDSEAERNFNAIKNSFESIMSCSRIWHVEASGDEHDWKRTGGASQTVRRKVVVPKLSIPSRVQSNIKVPMLQAGRQTIYFFPDRILVYESNGVGVVSYKTLEIDISKNRFIEKESVPLDAIVVDKTWQYVNKKGGPDRRFSNNREIPIVQYEEMHLKSTTGLNELFMLSKADVALSFVSSLNKDRG